MKILYVTAEMPFSKVGGLADVSGSLPNEIYKKNVDIRIITPFYKQIDKQINNIQYNIKEFALKGLTIDDKIIIHQMLFESVMVYLLNIKRYFDRAGIYTYSSGEGFEDNSERYAVFCWAVLQLLREINWFPDIIHLNDWHTGFIPAWLKTKFYLEAFKSARIKTIFVIHNIGYQGEFNIQLLDKLGLEESELTKIFSHNKDGNPLKAGISLANKIVTVSPTYAKEIQTAKYGAGLESILVKRSESIMGILNGINNDEWNPEKDSYIPKTFSLSDLTGKSFCKNALQKKFFFESEQSIPLIGNISRLSHQKGYDLLIPVLKHMLEGKEVNFQFVLIGTGNKDFADRLKNLESKYSDKISINIEYSTPLAHLIEAGSDFFLMPSKYEPCGLNQMYSMRYGTFPIVRETGGLKDTVIDIDFNLNKGTGFSFKDYSEKALQSCIKRSINWFETTDKNLISNVRKRIMAIDFSWEKSANNYYSLYNQLIS